MDQVVSTALSLLEAHAWLRALTWLLGGLLAAWLCNVLCLTLLPRLAAKTKTDLDDRLVELGRTPLVGSVALLGVWRAAGALSPSPGIAYALQGLLSTVAVVLWALAAQRGVCDVLAFIARQQGRSRFVVPRTLPVFDMAIKGVVFGSALYSLLLAWDVNVGAWLASAGVVGIAVGFAAKDTLANLFAGVFIIADAPYRLGDYLVLENGMRGRVEEIGLRSTRIITRDDVAVIIPNAEMANSRIVNESAGPAQSCRVTGAVSVAYGSDIDQVRAVLLEASKEVPEIVLNDPRVAPRVRFRKLGDSGLEFHLLVWAREPEAKGRVTDALNGAMYKALRRAGIEIPYPKTDVYLHPSP